MSIAFPGERKQVSIVESQEEEKGAARRRREKFQRQDTPLHPPCVRYSRQQGQALSKLLEAAGTFLGNTEAIFCHSH